MSISRENHYGGATYNGTADEKVQLTLGSRFKFLRPSWTGQVAYLPNATVLPIGEGGPIFVIQNQSQNASICLKTFTGTTVGKIPHQTTAMVFLKDASTASGTWVVCTGTLGSGESWSVGLSGTCDDPGPATTTPRATTPDIEATTTTRSTFDPDIGATSSTRTLIEGTTTVITFFGSNANQEPSNAGDLNPWRLPADAEAFFDSLENNLEGDRISSLIQSDGIAATANAPINRILGLRIDGSTALSTVGGALRGVAYIRRAEQATAEQSGISNRF